MNYYLVNIYYKFEYPGSENSQMKKTGLVLSGVDYYEDSTYIELSRVDGKKKIPVPSQLEKGFHDRLWFIPGRTIKKGEKVIFEIRRIPGEKISTGISAKKDAENIQLLSNGSEILSYRHALTDVPSGIDPLYRKYGGYIHPLKSPSGKEQHRDWLDSIKSRKQPIAPAETGHRSCSACLVIHIAMKLGRKLFWDPQIERFTKDNEANAMLSRPQCKPYGTDQVKF
jgi:hypothetical protein